MLFTTAAICVNADETDNGVMVTILTDKQSYSAGDTAVVTVKVENTSDNTLEDVTIYAKADNWLLSKGSKSNVSNIGILNPSVSTEMTFNAVVNRKASGLSFFSKIVLFFKQLFSKPSEFATTSFSDKIMAEKTIIVNHGGADVKVTAICYYVIKKPVELTDKEIADMQSVDTQLCSLISLESFANLDIKTKKEKVNNLLDTFEKDGLIQSGSVEWDKSSNLCTYTFPSGVLGGVMLDDFNADYYGQTKNEPKPENILYSNLEANGIFLTTYDALILNFGDISEYALSTIKNNWKNVGVETWVDDLVTVNDLSGLTTLYETDYDVICFSGHGSIYKNESVLCLREKADKYNRKTYASDLKNNRIADVNTKNGSCYWVFPSFISFYYNHSQLEGKFVFAECCDFFGEGEDIDFSFANAFYNAGVKGLVGFHNSINSSFADGFMNIWVMNLANGKTGRQAFDVCVEKNGEYCNNARAIFSGDVEAKLKTKKNKTIEFGSYPQSQVTDGAIISALNSKGGSWKSYNYYLTGDNPNDGKMKSSSYMYYKDVTYQNEKYRGVRFTAYRPHYLNWVWTANDDSFLFQEKNGYKKDTVYWFKYEPLKWRILDKSTGFIICETIIDSQAYNNYTIWNGKAGKEELYYGNPDMTFYANDYANSSLRKWLNNDFYNTAFSSEEKANIRTTALNNKCRPTLSGTSGYERFDSADTDDKVFIPSYDEIISNTYGFDRGPHEIDNLRRIEGSDYAKCQGLCVFNNYDWSEWWLRTPEDISNFACTIDFDGCVNFCITDAYDCGVCPAIRININ
jgi:hypothetical protein